MLTKEEINNSREMFTRNDLTNWGFKQVADQAILAIDLQTKLDAQTDISCALGLDQVKKRQEIFALQAELDALITERRWVAVSERLPDERETVVVGHCYGTCMGWHNGKYWYNGHGSHITDVTHWMPLPQPPKEEQQ